MEQAVENLNMSFAVIRDENEFWVTYEMTRISHSSGSYEEPPESIYEFVHGSAAIISLDETVSCPIDYDAAQELAEEHAKKHEVQVG